MAKTRRHRRITVGDAVGIVRYQTQAHSVVPNINIWMVPGVFGYGSNTVYELHSGDEILESPVANQFAFYANP